MKTLYPFIILALLSFTLIQCKKNSDATNGYHVSFTDLIPYPNANNPSSALAEKKATLNISP
jgi:hypothetical protein